MQGQRNRQHAPCDSEVLDPTYTVGQLIFLHSPITPEGLSPKLHSFWRGPHEISHQRSDSQTLRGRNK